MSIIQDPFAHSSKERGRLIVYGSSTSRVRKVLWTAAEAGVEVERVDIPTIGLKQQNWFADINPKLTVPVMRDSNLVLNESNTIISYILSGIRKTFISRLSRSPSASMAVA